MFRVKTCLLSIAIMVSTSLISQNQVLSDTPRLVVYGEASVKADADVITCGLNIYDNSYTYDYTQPYDDKKLKKDQQSMIERLGVKEFMTNPTYANLKGYNGTGPFEVRFNNKSQYDAVMKKIQDNYSESISVSMDIYKTEVSDAKRKQLYLQTLDQAIVDGASKAQKMATSLKATIGTPVYVEEMNITQAVAPGLGVYDYDYGYGNVDMQVTIKSTVQLQYLIK